MNINTVALMRSIIYLVVTGGALILLQLWFDLFSEQIFWKLFVTLLVIGGVVSVVLAVRADMSEEKKLKDDNFVN